MLHNAPFWFKALIQRGDAFFSKAPSPLLDFGIKEGMHVVEIACGAGTHLSQAARLVGSDGLITAIDSSPAAISAVNERAFRKGHFQIMGRLADGHEIPLDDQTADLIYTFALFSAPSPLPLLLQEVHRILAPHGHFFVHPQKTKKSFMARQFLGSNLFIPDGEAGGCLRFCPRKKG